MLVYCGYIGGSLIDRISSIAVDSAGNAYVFGSTQSSETTFPATVGPDLALNGGFDAFVAKINAAGTALVYCGYIGGNSTDDGYNPNGANGNSIAVDSAGNAYVVGVTGSTEATFPVTVGPDLTNNGGRDAFIAKVNASGTALDYCGYIGGSGTDNAYGVAVDSAGNAYVNGDTFSSEATFPVTVGPDLTYNGGGGSGGDVFVAKVNAGGTALDYCGYIGGSGTENGGGIAVDSAGNAYLAGQTASSEATFPVTVGPDLTSNGGVDAFVAKVNANGTALVYCGYIGGSGGDASSGIAVDGGGNAYLSGLTQSTESSFPVSVGPDLTHNGGFDAFVSKVNSSGTALVYCGYIGGSSTDLANGIALDSVGNAYVIGQTASTQSTFPVTVGPDLTHNGSGDAYVAKINLSGTALIYCGYIGGSGNDDARGIALDSAGNAYVGGYAASTETTFPVTVGPDLTYNSGVQDAFVAKIDNVAPEINVKGNSTTIAGGSTTPNTTDGTDFGSAAANTNAVAHYFTIENTGPVALDLTGTPKVALSGANASDFSIAVQPTSPVAATSGTTTFLVNFAPTATGPRTATVSIANDDLDENPYTFAIQGTGTPAPSDGPVCTNFTNKTTANGLGTNNVKGVFAVGSTVYAATSGGLSISTDGGASFTNKTTTNGLGDNNVNSVYAVGNTVYAATNSGGLSISTDSGASFTTRTTAQGLGSNFLYGVYVVDGTVYVATNGGGLSISTDGGASFTTRTTANGLGNNAVRGVYAVGSTVYAPTNSGLSISTDGGATFTTRTTANGLGSDFTLSIYAAGSTVYVGTGGGGLSISTDGGTSFTTKKTADGLGDNGVYGVYAAGSTVYAATFGGLGISTNGGSSFTNYTSANGLGSSIVTGGVYATATSVYAATFSGLSFCSSNTPPTITAGGTFTRQQGSPSGAAVQIATVGDTETALGSLSVAATTVPTGITVGSINNTGGAISATLAAGCNAPIGNNTVTLTVTDSGGLTATATFTVNVTANDLPTVGTYANQALAPGGGTTVTPSAAPTDNGSIANVTASASPNTFTGSFSGNTTTGAVTITNAAPSGSYTVTVTVTDNCGATTQQTFTLTVNGAPTLGPIPLSLAQGTTSAVLANVATLGDTETAPSNLTFQISADGSTFGSSATLNGVAVALVLPPPANGQVKANVTTTCAATSATFTLKVTDAGGLSVTAPWTVTVTANTPPTLSYANQSFAAGTTPSFSPSAGPSDNGAVTNIALQSITPSNGLTLTVNPTTGQVTVTGATIAQTYTVVIRATDDCGQTTDATCTVTLPCPAIALTPTTLPNASVNTAYNQTLSATPAGGNYSFAVTGGLLPAGLTLNANGTFSGAPTQGGTFNFRVTATGFGGCSAFQDCTLLVNCPSISITTATLPGGTLGTAYNQTLAVSPAGTYSFAVTSGALPTGLTLNASNGAITGTPNTTGSFAFTVTASNGGCSASQSFTVAIACAGVSLSPATLPGGQAGVAYSQSITVTPAGSYTFSIVQGNLPSGLTLNPSTGLISGLPTVTGTSTFIVKAKAANGCEATGTHTLTLTCPTITLSPATLPNGQTGTAYNQSLTVSPIGGNYTFVVSGGSLPPGLTLNPATGVISGTPTANGTSTFTVTVNGFGGCTGSREYTVIIGSGSCQTVTLPASLPNGSVGQFYSNSVAATPAGSYSYTSSGNLPPGVTLYGSIGLLFGYPTANGSYNFTITATNGNDCTGSQSYSVVIGTGSALAVNDFSGDRRSDFVLWRASQAQWLIVDSAIDTAQSIQWGQAGDRAVPGDYDGDGKADLAAFGKDGHWRVRFSNGGTLDKLWGLGSDVPVPGDYDGDGKADIAVWRGSDTTWYIQRSSDGQTQTVSWGASYAPYFDVPVPGDYDGDGKMDIAVFRTGNGHWYIKRSSDGAVMDKHWGLGTDVPVPGDYDGDGMMDIAVWRGSEGVWYIIQSSNGALKSKFWGAAYEPYFDVPAVGDYDGDGKADVTVWRKAEGRWYVLQSSDGAVRTITHGKADDQPIPTSPR